MAPANSRSNNGNGTHGACDDACNDDDNDGDGDTGGSGGRGGSSGVMAEFARLASSLLDFRGSRRRRQFEKPLRVAQFLRHHGFHRSLDSGRVVDLCLSWNGRNSKADVINTNNSSSGGGGGSSHDLGSGSVLVHHDGLEAAVGYAASDGECQRVFVRRLLSLSSSPPRSVPSVPPLPPPSSMTPSCARPALRVVSVAQQERQQLRHLAAKYICRFGLADDAEPQRLFTSRPAAVSVAASRR